MKKLLTFTLIAAMLLSIGAFSVSADPGDTVIYQENFDTYEDTDQSELILNNLGWKPDYISDHAESLATVPYKDPTAEFSIVDKRLKIDSTVDSYYIMVSEEEMQAHKDSNISVQYDIEYYSSGNHSRYIVIVTNYSGQRYNSFHLRMNGSGNSQMHHDNKWYTFDVEGTGMFAAGDDAAKGQSIINKLTGSTWVTGSFALVDMNLTIKYVIDWTKPGPECYVRNNYVKDAEFIKVSEAAADTPGAALFNKEELVGNAIVFKPGGAIVGYVDNIVIWAGTGVSPVAEPERKIPETTEAPVTTKKPETDRPVITTTAQATTATPTDETTPAETDKTDNKKSCGKSGAIIGTLQIIAVLGAGITAVVVKKR